MKFSSPITAWLFFVASCAPAATPPSLLPRAIEKQSAIATPVASPIMPKPLDTEIGAQVAALIAEARAGDEEFAKADRESAPAIAAGRGAKAGSEAWIAGEIARSTLQVAHQRSAAALSQLDSITIAHAARVGSDGDAGGQGDLRAALADVEAIVARQTARLDALNR